MKTLLLSLILAAGSVNAARIAPANNVLGINEAVTIQQLPDGTWGFTRSFENVSEFQVVLVPVTAKASATLQSLDRSARYSCTLVNSTFVQIHMAKAAYFVIDINCN